MTLSIIIVSFNTASLTRQTLESVVADLNQTPHLKKETEIIVVDNHSADESLDVIRNFQHTESELAIHLIENHDNLGFSRANNQGIKKSHGQYLLLLNSDTIVQPGALQALISTFETSSDNNTTAQLESAPTLVDRLGIVAAQLFNRDGTVQPQGGSFPTLFSLAFHMLMVDDLPVIGRWLPSTQHTGRRQSSSHTQLEPKDWVGGTAMMIRRAVIEEVGELDEQIFMYGEDVEFCLRARNHHWDVVIQPAAQVTHLGSASSSSANALKGELKGYLYIWSKHKPLWQQSVVRFLLQLGCRLRIFVFGTMMGDQPRARLYQEIATELLHA